MQLVSTVFDNHGNRIDRYEVANEPGQAPAVTLAVTLSERTDRNAEQVRAWYWREVGVMAQPADPWMVDPDHPSAALYADGVL